MKPELIIIAGPNGAGKTTFAKKFRTLLAPNHVYLNVDEIARLFSSVSSSIDAGRIHLTLLDRHLSEKNDVILESTLSGLGYLRLVKRAKAVGYTIMIHYLELEDADASVARVRKRVSAGGHDVPERDIRRRFERSKRNFTEKYNCKSFNMFPSVITEKITNKSLTDFLKCTCPFHIRKYVKPYN